MSYQPKMNIAIFLASLVNVVQHIILKHNICSRDGKVENVEKGKAQKFYVDWKNVSFHSFPWQELQTQKILRRVEIENIFISHFFFLKKTNIKEEASKETRL